MPKYKFRDPSDGTIIILSGEEPPDDATVDAFMAQAREQKKAKVGDPPSFMNGKKPIPGIPGPFGFAKAPEGDVPMPSEPPPAPKMDLANPSLSSMILPSTMQGGSMQWSPIRDQDGRITQWVPTQSSNPFAPIGDVAGLATRGLGAAIPTEATRGKNQDGTKKSFKQAMADSETGLMRAPRAALEKQMVKDYQIFKDPNSDPGQKAEAMRRMVGAGTLYFGASLVEDPLVMLTGIEKLAAKAGSKLVQADAKASTNMLYKQLNPTDGKLSHPNADKHILEKYDLKGNLNGATDDVTYKITERKNETRKLLDEVMPDDPSTAPGIRIEDVIDRTLPQLEKGFRGKAEDALQEAWDELLALSPDGVHIPLRDVSEAKGIIADMRKFDKVTPKPGRDPALGKLYNELDKEFSKQVDDLAAPFHIEGQTTASRIKELNGEMSELIPLGKFMQKRLKRIPQELRNDRTLMGAAADVVRNVGKSVQGGVIPEFLMQSMGAPTGLVTGSRVLGALNSGAADPLIHALSKGKRSADEISRLLDQLVEVSTFPGTGITKADKKRELILHIKRAVEDPSTPENVRDMLQTYLGGDKFKSWKKGLVKLNLGMQAGKIGTYGSEDGPDYPARD